MNSLRLSVVAAVNDDQTLQRNLLRSPLLASGAAELKTYRGFASAGAAYNRGLDETSGDLVVFAHQDVYLPSGWAAALDHAVSAVAARDPDWAVIGAFGLDFTGQPAGRVWSSGLGRLLGGPFAEPVPCVSVDEFLIVLRRASGIRFDAELPDFHLYGTDIVLSAHAVGRGCYVADIVAIHNSRPVIQLKADYSRAHRYMRDKWRAVLPTPTLIVPLTGSGWPLAKARLRMRLSQRQRLAHAVDCNIDPQILAQRLGIERDLLPFESAFMD